MVVSRTRGNLPLPRPVGEGAERSEAGEGTSPPPAPHTHSLRKAESGTQRARQLREDQTPPEGILWKELRSSRLGGFKFRRQHPVGRYVLDFYCHSAGLAIEVDGSSHSGDRKLKDIRRDAWLNARGILVMRVTASEVSKDLDSVLQTVLRRCRERKEAIETGRMQKKE